MKFFISFSLFVFLSVQIGYSQEKEACPCCTEQHQEFHFWLGDWETFGLDDKLVGTNNIVLMQDGCVMQENWKSAAGKYAGTSYNFYNAESNTWVQTWVDNQGGSLQLEGAFRNGKMVLMSQPVDDKKGGSYINRITWTPNEDGSVRQLWETSSDFGTTWNPVFDGLYKKKN